MHHFHKLQGTYNHQKDDQFLSYERNLLNKIFSKKIPQTEFWGRVVAAYNLLLLSFCTTRFRYSAWPEYLSGFSCNLRELLSL